MEKGGKTQSFKGFLLLSLRKTGKPFAAYSAAASPFTVEGVCIALTLWKASVRLPQFIAWSFHADQHPWDTNPSLGMPKHCEHAQVGSCPIGAGACPHSVLKVLMSF